MKTSCTLIALLFTTASFGQVDSVKVKKVVIKTEPSDTVSDNMFQKVEIEASIDPEIWRQHLSKAMVPIMNKAIKKKIPAGKYIVNVRFIVERDGSITHVEAANDPGYGLAQGAVKVVQSGPNWNPGVQNGQKVRSFRTQPIAFVFTD